MTNNTEILRTEGLKRSYLVNETKIDVLKGINLTINNQEFIAIMGKSGSGKTTLLKLLGMLDRPTEGKVFFKGEDSNSLRGDRLAMIRRREIGFIYQDYYLMDSLSVRENIMLPKILDHSPVEESITEAEKLADIMGVRALLDKKIFELSGGEKQRAAICRALMNHSDLILADEPTGNLDSASSETVMEYLQMINKDLKKAIGIHIMFVAIAQISNLPQLIHAGALRTADEIVSYLLFAPIDIFVVQSIYFFGEEYAWRGCLQGRLQNIFGKRMGVILLGIIWELWHMPLWFQISEPGQGKLIVLLVLMRMPYVIALAVFLGWAYMKTNNIWLCVLIHGVNNAAGSAFDSDLVTVADTVESVSVFDGIMTAVAVIVMLLFLFTKEYRKGKRV